MGGSTSLNAKRIGCSALDSWLEICWLGKFRGYEGADPRAQIFFAKLTKFRPILIKFDSLKTWQRKLAVQSIIKLIT